MLTILPLKCPVKHYGVSGKSARGSEGTHVAFLKPLGLILSNYLDFTVGVLAHWEVVYFDSLEYSSKFLLSFVNVS